MFGKPRPSIGMNSQHRILCSIRMLFFEGEWLANSRTPVKQKTIDHFELGEERADTHRRSKDTQSMVYSQNEEPQRLTRTWPTNVMAVEIEGARGTSNRSATVIERSSFRMDIAYVRIQ
jgi:hypothetical protein